FNAIHPPFFFQLMEGLSRGRIADTILLDDVIFRWHRGAGSQRSALNFGNDLAADLKVFRRRESVPVRIVVRSRLHSSTHCHKKARKDTKKDRGTTRLDPLRSLR